MLNLRSGLTPLALSDRSNLLDSFCIIVLDPYLIIKRLDHFIQMRKIFGELNSILDRIFHVMANEHNAKND